MNPIILLSPLRRALYTRSIVAKVIITVVVVLLTAAILVVIWIPK